MCFLVVRSFRKLDILGSTRVFMVIDDIDILTLRVVTEVIAGDITVRTDYFTIVQIKPGRFRGTEFTAVGLNPGTVTDRSPAGIDELIRRHFHIGKVHRIAQPFRVGVPSGEDELLTALCGVAGLAHNIFRVVKQMVLGAFFQITCNNLAKLHLLCRVRLTFFGVCIAHMVTEDIQVKLITSIIVIQVNMASSCRLSSTGSPITCCKRTCFPCQAGKRQFSLISRWCRGCGIRKNLILSISHTIIGLFDSLAFEDVSINVICIINRVCFISSQEYKRQEISVIDGRISVVGCIH